VAYKCGADNHPRFATCHDGGDLRIWDGERMTMIAHLSTNGDVRGLWTYNDPETQAPRIVGGSAEGIKVRATTGALSDPCRPFELRWSAQSA
jgi:hypothetical protein